MIKVLAISGALVIATFVFFGFSTQNRAEVDELERSLERGTLVWHSQMAKAKGKQSVLLGSTIVDYAVPRSMDDALANYHLVVAEPISSRSYPTTYNIQSWYKFRLIEELSAPATNCIDCVSTVGPPEDLLPLEPDEFLSAKVGGEVTVDGVRITSRDPEFPAFETGKRYLLLVAFDSKRIVGVLRSGPWGAFALNAADRLEPVNAKLKHPFSQKLSEQFGNSLATLRLNLKRN